MRSCASWLESPFTFPQPSPQTLILTPTLTQAVSNDRLLCFLRQVAGLVGEEVSNLVVRDEQAEEAQKAREAQELEVVNRISSAYSQILQTLLSGMSARSTLGVSRSQEGQIIVIDQAAKEELHALARGSSNVNQFFNARFATSHAHASALEPIPIPIPIPIPLTTHQPV